MIGNTNKSVEEPECPYAADDDVLRQFVSGRLTEPAAEAFEEHLFGCDRCRDEVERAIELRAALSGTAQRKSRPRARDFSLMAIAAAVGIVFLGVWQIRSRHQPVSPPLRSAASHEIAASGRLAGGKFAARWNAVSGARSYRVQVFNAAGEPVTRTETSGTSFSAPLAAAPGAAPLYWKVQALDQDRVVIASSDLQKIEPSR